jgi:hypothetical protein
MNVQLLNKISGTIAIILNFTIFTPWTWEIIKTGGGDEGFDYMFLPLTISFHLFILTGIFAWLKSDIQNDRRVKTALIIILYILSLSTIVIIGWVMSVLVAISLVAFFPLTGLTNLKNLKVEQTLLKTNIIGSIIMSVSKILLEL